MTVAEIQQILQLISSLEDAADRPDEGVQRFIGAGADASIGAVIDRLWPDSISPGFRERVLARIDALFQRGIGTRPAETISSLIAERSRDAVRIAFELAECERRQADERRKKQEAIDAARLVREYLRSHDEAPWNDARAIESVARRVVGALEGEDRILAELWAGPSASAYELARMHSARQAEIAAIGVYSELYGNAVDLSIGQLKGCGRNDEWRAGDVRSNGRTYDVKNARRAYSSRCTYSEHCVPRFKTDRNDRCVVISGFLSEYYSDVSVPSSRRVLWIGETSQEVIRELCSEFGEINWERSSDLSKANFLPPWLFEFPEKVYEKRDRSMKELCELVGQQSRCGDSLSWLSTGQWLIALLQPCAAVPPELSLEARLLLDRFAGVPHPSRPRLFQHVLDRFVKTHFSRGGFPCDAIWAALFNSSMPRPSSHIWTAEDFSDWCVPVAICDPLGTVATLIQTLAHVADECDRRRLVFSEFRLLGMNILQGRNGTAPWTTILAYCGGWLNTKRGPRRCGQSPLFLGRDASCRECNRLICHSCGYCSSDCRSCGPRQAELSQSAGSEPSPGANLDEWL